MGETYQETVFDFGDGHIVGMMAAEVERVLDGLLVSGIKYYVTTEDMPSLQLRGDLRVRLCRVC